MGNTMNENMMRLQLLNSILKRLFLISGIIVLIACWNGSGADFDKIPKLSIINDQSPGEFVLHGLRKLAFALQIKNIPFEQVKTIDEAKGKMIIVYGFE
jgi:hypothetical protein